MTLERPLWAALLLLAPIAWRLHRTRSGADVVRVASLLAFKGAAETSPSAAPRRSADLRLVLMLAAIVFCAAAAAGPSFGATLPAAFYVVIDKSISATARTCDAAARGDAVLKDAAPAAQRFDHPLGESGADGLPESLAPHLEAARADGFPGVVLVTDARIESLPGVAVVGPSTGAKVNVALASAALDGDEAVVVLRNYGALDVSAKVRCADVVRDVVVPAGAAATARFAAPDRGESATFRIEGPPDDLAADDVLVASRRGGARRVRLVAAAPCPHLESALRAAGAQIVRDVGAAADVVVEYRNPFDRRDASPRLVVAPGGGTPTSGEDAAGMVLVETKSPVVRGDAVVGRGEFADVLPAPATTLVAASRLVGGRAAWSVADGAIAASAGDVVVLAVDPEDVRGDWRRDPSFPAFVAAALDRLAGGPERLETAGAVAPSESDVVHEPPKSASVDEIRAVMRAAGAEPGAVRPARWLALAAAALLVAAAVVRPR